MHIQAQRQQVPGCLGRRRRMECFCNAYRVSSCRDKALLEVAGGDGHTALPTGSVPMNYKLSITMGTVCSVQWPDAAIPDSCPTLPVDQILLVYLQDTPSFDDTSSPINVCLSQNRWWFCLLLRHSLMICSDWPGTCYADQAGLEIREIHLPPLPECWD